MRGPVQQAVGMSPVCVFNNNRTRTMTMGVEISILQRQLPAFYLLSYRQQVR